MASEQDLAAQRIYVPNILHNQSLYNVKFVSACSAGAIAGIMGLENWQGFLLFAISTLLGAFTMYVVNCKTMPTKFLSGGISELVNPGQENLFSFVLVWTLAYGKEAIITHCKGRL